MNRDEFKTTNAQLRDLRFQLIDCDEQIRLKEKEQLAFNSEMMSDICSTIDEATGKPLFSNAEKRDAELAIRQTNSRLWAECDEQLSDYRLRAAQLRANISFFDNDIKYGINHAADEINDQLGILTAAAEQASTNAAFHAVRHLLAQLSIPEDPQ